MKSRTVFKISALSNSTAGFGMGSISLSRYLHIPSCFNFGEPAAVFFFGIGSTSPLGFFTTLLGFGFARAAFFCGGTGSSSSDVSDSCDDSVAVWFFGFDGVDFFCCATGSSSSDVFDCCNDSVNVFLARFLALVTPFLGDTCSI